MYGTGLHKDDDKDGDMHMEQGYTKMVTCVWNRVTHRYVKMNLFSYPTIISILVDVTHRGYRCPEPTFIRLVHQ